MLDFQDIMRLQVEGLRQVETIDDLEREVLTHFCSLSAEALMRMGAQRKAPIDEVMVNAFKNGLALGLRLTINNREVFQR